MPCYASRRGLGESIHDRCEIVKLMVYLRWQLKHTSRWIEAPGYSSGCLFFFWTATQAQRDHEIIHTRNFHVQWCLVHNLLLVDVVGPASAQVCRTVANFPQVDDLRFVNHRRCRMKMVSLKQPYNQITKSLLCPQHTQYNGRLYRCTSSAKRWRYKCKIYSR